MKMFNPDGHLTNQALQALNTSVLDELSRLEAAEHLSFCDQCLLRYTEVLEQGQLITPPDTLKPKILAELRRRSLRLFSSRYATAVAAAGLALVLWSGGVFGALMPDIQQTPPQKAAQEQTALFAQADKLVETMNDRLNDLLKIGQLTEQQHNNDNNHQ